MSYSNPQISIIIVNFNGLQFLKNCLDSIEKTLINVSYEIILVDNASTDGSVNFINQYYLSKITLIKSEENLGFGKGNNLGVRSAKGEFLLLLNNDTILHSDLDVVLQKFVDKKVGAVGIKMLGKNGEYRLSAGYFPSVLRLLRLKSLYKTDQGFNNALFKKDLYEVDWIEASFLLVRRKTWDHILGFDEDYFMYVEDIDICKKIKNKGFKILYLTQFNFTHYGGYSESREHLLKQGLLLYVKKHFGLFSKNLAQLSIFLNFSVKSIKNQIKKRTQKV
ncbi:MAG: hypothetical protein Wins2KO_04510 [Winogradskyella sp.]